MCLRGKTGEPGGEGSPEGGAEVGGEKGGVKKETEGKETGTETGAKGRSYPPVGWAGSTGSRSFSGQADWLQVSQVTSNLQLEGVTV